jgi:hypothetical protein
MTGRSEKARHAMGRHEKRAAKGDPISIAVIRKFLD